MIWLDACLVILKQQLDEEQILVILLINEDVWACATT
jgi:hypothetical protein